MTATAAAVLLAAGSGTRSGLSTNKVFASLAGRPVLSWSLEAIRGACFGPVVVVVRPDEVSAVEALLAAETPGPDVRVVLGGATRSGSERNAMLAIGGEVRSGKVDVVAVHDAARPLAPASLFADTVAAAREHGGAVPGRRQDGLLSEDLLAYPGEVLAVQTPQAFRADLLMAVHDMAAARGFAGTDTAACVERFAPQLRIRALSGPATNLKITFAEDLALAERLVASGSW